ncbi:hypothetical protein FGADI_1857, partial [Fusarium gaditjirri]
MVDLTDNAGNKILSGPENWYKIVLADGSEFGIGYSPGGYYWVGIVPAGHGMVVRYQRFPGDDRLNQGWPIGDKGYFRCMQIDKVGKTLLLNLSMLHRRGYVSQMAEHPAHGMRAEQLAHNRVALYGYDEQGKLGGLRVIWNSGERNVDEGWIEPDYYAAHLTGLDCEFVK